MFEGMQKETELEVGRFHNCGYKFDRWYDMIWMEKLIGPHDAHPDEVHFGEWDISGETGC